MVSLVVADKNNIGNVFIRQASKIEQSENKLPEWSPQFTRYRCRTKLGIKCSELQYNFSIFQLETQLSSGPESASETEVRAN